MTDTESRLGPTLGTSPGALRSETFDVLVRWWGHRLRGSTRRGQPGVVCRPCRKARLRCRHFESLEQAHPWRVALSREVRHRARA